MSRWRRSRLRRDEDHAELFGRYSRFDARALGARRPRCRRPGCASFVRVRRPRAKFGGTSDEEHELDLEERVRVQRVVAPIGVVAERLHEATRVGVVCGERAIVGPAAREIGRRASRPRALPWWRSSSRPRRASTRGRGDLLDGGGSDPMLSEHPPRRRRTTAGESPHGSAGPAPLTCAARYIIVSTGYANASNWRVR